MAYVAEMCRLFGVSSDWLLLGAEESASAAPSLCPSCQHTVTRLDNFCPNCGWDLRVKPASTYTLVLNQSDSPYAVSDLQLLSTKLQGKVHFAEGDPLGHRLTEEEASELVHSTPAVLARGLTKDQICTILDSTVSAECLFVCPEAEDRPDDPPLLQGMRPAADLQPGRNYPSFGGMVLAVIVGIFGALLIASFL